MPFSCQREAIVKRRILRSLEAMDIIGHLLCNHATSRMLTYILSRHLHPCLMRIAIGVVAYDQYASLKPDKSYLQVMPLLELSTNRTTEYSQTQGQIVNL